MPLAAVAGIAAAPAALKKPAMPGWKKNISVCLQAEQEERGERASEQASAGGTGTATGRVAGGGGALYRRRAA